MIEFGLQRLASFLKRTIRLAPFTGGRVAAMASIVLFKARPNKVQQLQYHGRRFGCRRADLQAVEEVLIDKEYEFLLPTLRTDIPVRVLDIGAHIGTFAIWLLHYSPHSNVVSIEADPETFHVLNRTAAVSRVSGKSWNVVHRAAASTDGNIAYVTQDGPSMSHRISESGSAEVVTINLSTAVALLEGGPIDILKVDIEGAEEDFLCINHHSLSNVSCVIVELHPDRCNTDRVRKTLNSHYEKVRELPRRKSSKPLLFAFEKKLTPT